MADFVTRAIRWYDTKCCGSQKMRILTEWVFWLLRVEPHQSRFRDGADRFYVVMVIFSGVYMGLLSASLFFEEVPKGLEYYLASSVISMFYIVLAVIYTIAKEIQKKTSHVKKRRGGQFVVYLWTALALTFFILTAATERVAYSVTDPSLVTLIAIAAVSQAHVWGSRLTREPIMNGVEKIINGIQNYNKGAP